MTGGPGHGETRTAALLIRVWTEPGSPGTLRARLLEGGGPDGAGTWSTAVGDAAIGRDVQRWLRHVRDADAQRRPAGEDGGEGGGDPGGRLVEPLVGTGWLAGHLDDPGVAVVEVGDLRGEYEAGHVPGAAWLHWIADLQHPARRAFLDAPGFAATMDRLGIGAHTHVVLCAAGQRIPLAATAYWCFAYHGHRRLSLLDGGRGRWAAEGRPLSTDPPARRPTTGYPPGPGRRELLVTRDELLAGLVGAPPGTALVDCRSSREYGGQPAQAYDLPVDRHRMVGHIPGARSLPAEAVLDGDGLLLPEPRLRELCTGLGIDPGDHVVVYCGVADRSALVWFVLHELLGWPDVSCYSGAWSEYGSLADVPVERDAGPAEVSR
jgi:thiosulfate/3-mercaptopyruvate sulfurtransferase